MSTLTINNQRIVSARITIPYYGPWVADVALADATELTSPCTIVVADLTLVGTVVRQASFTSSRSARIVGGGGGWRKELPAKGYSHPAGVKLSTVLQDAAREAGETIVVASDRSIGTGYAREQAPAQRVLELETAGQWWIDGAGVTQTGPRVGGAIATPFTVESWSGSRGQFVIAAEMLASWLPGRSFSGPTVPSTQTISSVTIEASNDGKLRLAVLSTDGEKERLQSTLRALIRSEIAALSYFGVWEYTVKSGTAKTVDLVASDKRMPNLTKCPMMPGLMGEKVTPTPGSKARVVFVNGDPTRFECVGIEGTPLLTEIDASTVVKIADGVRPVAAMGDLAGGIWPILATTRIMG